MIFVTIYINIYLKFLFKGIIDILTYFMILFTKDHKKNEKSLYLIK